MRSRIIFCGLLLACFFYAGPGARAAWETTVSGRVLWSETRAPVSGAVVSIYRDGSTPPGVTESDVHGYFNLPVPSAGWYRIGVSMDSSPGIIRSLPVTNRGTWGGTLTLPERFRASEAANAVKHAPVSKPPIRLEISDAAGQPVRRDRVQVWIVQAARRSEGLSAAGRWSEINVGSDPIEISAPLPFSHLTPTRVGIAVRSALYGTARVMLDRWPDAPVKIRLHPAPGLTGTVVDSSGNPVRGAEVTATGAAMEPPFRFLQGWAWAATDEAGQFHIPALFPGRYGVQVSPPDIYLPPGRVHYVTIPRASLALQLPTKPGDTSPPLYAFGINDAQPPPEGWLSSAFHLGRGDDDFVISFGNATLEAPARTAPVQIEGYIRLAPNAAPVPGCRVRLYQKDGSFPLDEVLTTLNGAFSISAPRPGAYRLAVGDDNYVPQDHAVTVPKTGAVPISILVSPSPTAEVLAVDADGHPMAGKYLTVWMITPHSFDSKGAYPAKGLPLKLLWHAPTAPTPGEPLTFGARSDAVGVGTVTMDHWPTEPVILKLTPGATLHCRVLEAAGKPNTHATVEIVRRFDTVTNKRLPSFFFPNNHKTDYNGEVEFEHLAPGGYVLMVQVYPELPYSRRVVVTGPETSITLKPDPVTVDH